MPLLSQPPDPKYLIEFRRDRRELVFLFTAHHPVAVRWSRLALFGSDEPLQSTSRYKSNRTFMQANVAR